MGGPNAAPAVRRCSRGDVAAVARLFDAYRQFYGQAPDPEGAPRFIEARLDAGDSVLLLAEAGGDAVGFCQLYPTYSSIRMKRTYILNDLFVAPEARGAGIAKALIREAEMLARGAGARGMSLSTERNNKAAQALYRSLGWTQDETFITFHRSLD